jgi:hypothetical protein
MFELTSPMTAHRLGLLTSLHRPRGAAMRGLVWAVLVVLVWAQLAVAAYACQRSVTAPGWPGDAPARQASEAVPGMSADCAELMGWTASTQANLCVSHCHAGDQSDQTAPVAWPLAALAALYGVPPAPLLLPTRRQVAARAGEQACLAPPHRILHCVQRT